MPQVGGRGQERLLAARVAIIGEIADVSLPLAYLVGAGVGTVLLDMMDGGTPECRDLIGEMKGLNPEVTVAVHTSGAEYDLGLIFIGSARSRDGAQAANLEARASALIAARLDSPGQIAITPKRPPCLACIGELLGNFGTKDKNAELVKMVATTEALKYLLQPGARASRLQFDGLASRECELTVAEACILCTSNVSKEREK
ncbi:MAG TPA: hypothetical protein VMB26_16280 [Candidatus Binataceae bacterium]|nr:hypothetical protein [Candidatus Binataceae bacterium]